MLGKYHRIGSVASATAGGPVEAEMTGAGDSPASRVVAFAAVASLGSFETFFCASNFNPLTPLFLARGDTPFSCSSSNSMNRLWKIEIKLQCTNRLERVTIHE